MSKLRGKPGVEIKKRMKVFFYGRAGSGKTTCAINFPKPYYIDTERGGEHSQYIKILEERGGVMYQTNNFFDVEQEVKALATESHDYETLIIDPISPLYHNLVDAYKIKYGRAHGICYTEANSDFRRFFELLKQIDMNIVVTAHSKKEYGQDMSLISYTFDGYSKVDHACDLVIEAKNVGREYNAVVEKSRILTIPAHTELKFSYAAIHELYKADTIEGKSQPLLELEAVETINQIATQEEKQKILTHYSVSKIEDLSPQLAVKVVDILTKRRAAA